MPKTLQNTSPTPVPPPAAPMNVGQTILYYLGMEGVRHVFGIPGGGLMNLLYQFMLDKENFNYIMCRQETGAAYIADGYHRVTGKLGVVMVTSGPGATNALTGVMNANADGSAMLLITGEVPQEYDGMGYLQEGENLGLDLDVLYRACTSYSTVIESGATAHTYLKQALREIFARPGKAAHISLPDNVTTELIPAGVTLPKTPSNYRTAQSGAFLNDVTDTLKMLQKAKRPVIFIGNGCRGFLTVTDEAAAAENREDSGGLHDLIHLAEAFGIPVMTTADAKGIFPESHELSLRVFGIANCQWPYYWLNTAASTAADPFDAILVIGSSLGDLATSKYSALLYPAAPHVFYQVDVNPAGIGRTYPVTKGIVAEAGAFIHMLHEQMKHHLPDAGLVEKRRRALSEIKKAQSPFFSAEQYNSNDRPVRPAALMRVLQEKLPAARPVNFFIDAGNCVGWANHYLEVSHPWRIFSSLSMGPMGFGVASVIGGKIGAPESICISITGDGAFMMHGAEISTAQQHGVGAIWLVLQDNNLNMVTQGMTFFYSLAKPPVPASAWDGLYDIGTPDLAKYAEGLGADAYTITSPLELEDIMDEVVRAADERRKPQVIIAKINPADIPPYYNPLYKTSIVPV